MKNILLITFFFICVSLGLNVYAQPLKNPLIDESSVYISEQGVHRYELNDLSVKWSALTTLQTFEPVISGNTLLVGSTQGLYALDKNSGKVIWHVEEGHTVFSPVVFNGHLYSGSEQGVLYGISLVDGKINWKTQFHGWVYSPVVMAEQNQLWTGGQGHQAVAVNLLNGKLLNRIPLSQEVIYSPVKVNTNTVGYNLFNGSSVFIDVSTTTISNTVKGSSQAKSLLVNGDVIFRSSRDGRLSALLVDSKDINWQFKFVDAGLTLYSGITDRLLLTDDDQWLGLFDTTKRKLLWNKKIQGNWFLPIQLNHEQILVFYRNGLNLKNPVAVIVGTYP